MAQTRKPFSQLSATNDAPILRLPRNRRLSLTNDMAPKMVLDPIHPGEILLEEFMKPLGISINRLGRDLAVPPGRISAIVNGKRAITADTALRLAKYFRTSSELWLGLQAEFDLRIAKRTGGAEIGKRVQQQ